MNTATQAAEKRLNDYDSEIIKATAIKKNLEKNLKSMSIRWRAGSVKTLALAGLAARDALLTATGIEPKIHQLSSIVLRHCVFVLEEGRRKRRKPPNSASRRVAKR